MRFVLGALVPLAGCNQIFGLDPVTVAPPQDTSFETVPDPTVTLSYMIATTIGGAPDPTIDLTTPLPDPNPKVGTLSGELVPVTYDASATTVAFGRDLLTTKWRLEYTDDSGIPHELQWTPGGDAHVVVPHFGPLAPTPPLPGSGYRIQATGPGAPATFTSAHLVTSGIWMDVNLGAAANPVTVSLDGVVPLSGPRGVPATSDSAALLDLQSTGTGNNTCTRAIGNAGFSPPAVSGGLSDVSPTWSAGSTLGTVTYAGNFQALRLPASLESRAGLAASKIEFGRGAHDRMPAFTRQDLTNPTLAEPGPVMLVLASCKFENPSVPAFSDPANFVGFPYFTRTLVRDERTVGSVTLISSLSAVSSSTAPNFTSDTSGPIAHAPIALGDATTMLSLSGNFDKVQLPAGAGQLDLTFNLDTLDRVDYFEVSVFRIEGTQLVPLRVYTATDTRATPTVDGQAAINAPIKIDRALFQAGNQYVLAIQTYRGRPRASLGDFSTVDPIQVVATIFTRTISVP